MNPQIYDFDIENPEQRIRKNGVPVGLKNIGNSYISFYDSMLFELFDISVFP